MLPNLKRLILWYYRYEWERSKREPDYIIIEDDIHGKTEHFSGTTEHFCGMTEHFRSLPGHIRGTEEHFPSTAAHVRSTVEQFICTGKTSTTQQNTSVA